MKTLYLDESGNHDLRKIDSDYPVFVLGGVIVEDNYAKTVLEAEVGSFKLRWFGSARTVLHTADMVRNRNEFGILRDSGVRERFYRDLNEMMQRLEYSVVACAIDKYAYVEDRGNREVDPYALGFEKLIEAFCLEIGDVEGGGEIIAEKRLPDLDRSLMSSWQSHIAGGTVNLSSNEIKRRLKGLDLKSKAENIAGLQLADLVVSPIGRHVIGKVDKEDWRIIEGKLLNAVDGVDGSVGLIRVP